MSARELIRLVLFNLRRMKFRVLMTATGVLVGTTAIVAMVALGLGLQQSFTSSLLTAAALNEITVLPGTFAGTGFAAQPQRATILDDKVVGKIERVQHVTNVVPAMSVGNVVATSGARTSRPISLQPFDPETPGSLEVDVGRVPRPSADDQVVISAQLDRAFLRPGEDPTRETVDLLGKSLRLTVSRVGDDGNSEERRFKVRVSGVATSVGADADFGTVWIPVALMKEMAAWEKDDPNFVRKTGYDALTVIVDSAENVAAVQQQLEEDDFQVFSLQDILGAVTAFFRVLQVILGGIGAVALLVAAIGITNTMVMSIYERTREIGIMKAVGASNRDIIGVFLTEASTIGWIGGVGGVLTGWGLAQLLGVVAQAYLSQQGEPSPLQFVVPWWLMVFGVVFATVVGLIAGTYPALRAARLNPLTALRHE